VNTVSIVQFSSVQFINVQP